MKSYGSSKPHEAAGSLAAGSGGMISLGRDMKQAAFVKPDYEAGDRVRHTKFGAGTVREIKKGSRDYEVSVEFDDCGLRTMMAAFARLQKI